MNALLAVFIGALMVINPATAVDTFVSTKPQEPLLRPTRFDNQMLLRVPKTKEFFNLAQDMNLDVWSVRGNTVEVRADAKQKRDLERRLKTITTVLDSNIQRAIDAETKELNKQLQTGRKFTIGDEEWHKQYHTFTDIVNWWKAVAEKYPNLVKFTPSIGKTEEDRDIPLVEITSEGSEEKKNVWFQAQQHAREWITGATLMYIVDKLTSGYGSDARVTAILKKVRFVCIPIVNPDGYEYTWKTNRLWRKNRGYKVNNTVYGVDMNRNWPEPHWGDSGGASTSPSSDTFKGPSAASTNGVQHLIKAYKSYADGFIGGIDWHSYSELLLRPYGWTTAPSPDEAAFADLGNKMKAVIKSSRGTDYTPQPSIQLYKTTGTTEAFLYEVSAPGAKWRPYGMTVELSPASWSFGGFELPAQYILPVGKEIFPAALTYVEYALEHPLAAK